MKTRTHVRNVLLFVSLFAVMGFVANDALGRAGGGRSFGNRGSRSYSAPHQAAPRYAPPSNAGARPYSNAAPMPPAPSAGGGLLRSFGAGLAGGVVGNMLFRGLGGGSNYGYGGGGGGGMGFLDILLLGGLIYLIYRLFKNRFLAPANPYPTQATQGYPYTREVEALPTQNNWSNQSAGASNGNDLSDQAPLIDRETSLDIFFRVQGAFGNRDLSPVKDILSSDAATYLGEEVETLKRNHRINKLENIAVRDAVVSEQWQENGQDWATIQFTANVIDYTVDEATQNVVEGSKTNSVRFEEFWTVSRPTGAGPRSWKLSAIQQGS